MTDERVSSLRRVLYRGQRPGMGIPQEVRDDSSLAALVAEAPTVGELDQLIELLEDHWEEGDRFVEERRPPDVSEIDTSTSLEHHFRSAEERESYVRVVRRAQAVVRARQEHRPRPEAQDQ